MANVLANSDSKRQRPKGRNKTLGLQSRCPPHPAVWSRVIDHLQQAPESAGTTPPKILMKDSVDQLEEANMTSITTTVMQHQLRWTGFVTRMSNTHLPKHIQYSQLKDPRQAREMFQGQYRDHSEEMKWNSAVPQSHNDSITRRERKRLNQHHPPPLSHAHQIMWIADRPLQPCEDPQVDDPTERTVILASSDHQ